MKQRPRQRRSSVFARGGFARSATASSGFARSGFARVINVSIETLERRRLLSTGASLQTTALPARQVELLNRGVVAVNKGSGAYVGWRLLGTDPSSIAFNLYR